MFKINNSIFKLSKLRKFLIYKSMFFKSVCFKSFFFLFVSLIILISCSSFYNNPDNSYNYQNYNTTSNETKSNYNNFESKVISNKNNNIESNKEEKKEIINKNLNEKRLNNNTFNQNQLWENLINKTSSNEISLDEILYDNKQYNEYNKNVTNEDIKSDIIFNFTVCGDNRPADDYLPQPDVFKEILKLIKGKNPSFHISVGDIINGQTKDPDIINRQFNDYLNVVSVLNTINFVSPGNHDLSNNTTRKYFSSIIIEKTINDVKNSSIEIHSLNNESTNDNLYYYFEYENIHFIILNAFEKGCWGAVKGQQLEWLEKILSKLSDERVFVFIHTPVFSVLNPDTITDGTKHVAFSSKKNLEYIKRLFKENRVDAVFSGHEHMYNKQLHDGTTYIITALSGEYPFVSKEDGGIYHFINVEIQKDCWVFYVIDKDGNVYYSEKVLFN